MNDNRSIVLKNESDVEQKFFFPLLIAPSQLAIPDSIVRTKEYLAPTLIDKRAGKGGGYYPDYSVWMSGLPILIGEAKDPTVAPEVGFREASLYARHLNSKFPTDLNPCRFILASNGVRVLAGYWDQDAPVLDIQVCDLVVGSNSLESLIKFCGISAIDAYATSCVEKIRFERGIRPYTLAGGQALINANVALNSFAADLSPVLRRYFSSTGQENIREIARRAYVSSSEITEYDRVLESLLKDRITPKRDTIVKPLRTSRNEERVLTETIQAFSSSEQNDGQLQIVQGGVGSGKSLFARRYRDVLEPEDLKANNFWAFVDFNSSPTSLKGAESWLCEGFIASFERENEGLNLYQEDVLRGIFSHKIVQRRAYYEQMKAISSDEEKRARANDIAAWQSNPVLLAEGIAVYIVGIRRKNLIVVLDNVDKLELQNQLDAFQLALWFMSKTKAFVIIQMRDETYERYKNRPPLDTFRTGIAFHISPPRFIDVVKRRLELGIEYLASVANGRQEFVLDNGARIVLPLGDLGTFLRSLYLLIFGRRTNLARVLEALAGRDVRKSLEMFVSIVTSGHLSTSAITSNVIGAGSLPIHEHDILRILMRGRYRFFSDNAEFISNIFHYENEWARPDNFLLVEALFYLSWHRKEIGELGLEGYFSVRRVCDALQKIGYDFDDAFQAINYLLRRQLIIADHYNFVSVTLDDCIKIQASGFIHLRILCERIEYLYGLIPVVPIADRGVAAELAAYVNRESQRGYATAREKVSAVEVLLRFLKYELNRLRERNPFFNEKTSGAAYVVRSMERCVARYYQPGTQGVGSQDELDLS